ncbi:MAG TPA: helix-turn-helix domain-containing protein [Thermoanaerobaculia bacterium]
MLGDTVRDQRIRKGFTQARLAKLAGVSRRHLAALEKGANVSILVVQKVAAVLDLTDIPLGGDLHLRPGGAQPQFNVALLAETVREAREETMRAQSRLIRVEGLLGGNDGSGDDGNLLSAAEHAVVRFPTMPVRYLDVARPRPPGNGYEVRDQAPPHEITTDGELRHGQPVDEKAKEQIVLPGTLVEKKELVFRARGEELRDQGIEDGDILIVETRPRGRAANGELVICKIGETAFVGRWWQKHGQKALMSNGLSEVTTGKSKRGLKVVAAINQIIRSEEKRES